MSKTTAEYLAEEAGQFSFQDLPPGVVHKAKQLILFTLGGGLLGHKKEPSKFMESFVREMGAAPEATVFGSGLKTSCLYATLANATKCSGYGDKNYHTPEARFHLGSQSGLIPPLLAVGERQHASGSEFLTAVVSAYELANKIYASLGGNFGLLDHGWSTDSVGRPCALALSAGRLLHLDNEQLVNALGIAGSLTLVPFIIYSPTVRHSPELRTSVALMNAIFSVFLASNGMTGPLDLFEGRYGLAEMATGGDMDLEKLKEPRRDWTILYAGVSTVAGDPDMAGFIEAASTLAIEHDIRPEDVDKVVVRTTAREARRLGDPAAVHLRAPKTREWAVHSCFYVTAVAIVYRGKGHEQFSEERLRDPDPRVVELMGKVSVEADPKFEGFNLRGGAEIILKSGQTFSREVLQPRGLHPMNPLRDDDNEELFRSRAGTAIGHRQTQEIIDTVYHLEKLDDVGELARLMVIPAGGA